MMWKPGTEKPGRVSNDGKTTRVNHDNNHNHNATPNKTKKRALSGATLGMRFMKRKAETQQQNHSTTNTTTTTTTTRSKMMSQGQHAREANASSMVTAAAAATNTGTFAVLLQDATPSDMYGIKSDLVGKRSFGGFHKSVQDTWNASRQSLEKDQHTSSSSSQHISDDELLRRYQEYVRGRGGGLEQVDQAAAAPIGNLGDKIKQPRKPTNKSGKRKR